jgi:hypothetical protein
MNQSISRLVMLPILLSLLPLSWPPQARAAASQDEIQHLLSFIRSSNCTFIRNGSRHDPQEAVTHIEKKYNYLKNRIKSTDDFIRGAATRSSLSGRDYEVICDGQTMKTADWLRRELARYRRKNDNR